ncbi:hypothetical protein ARMGADRAFT_1027442 [Armillaria gallica]|uniref:FACT complex subunit n=1 Tax=Armillaria gallica TaxID=47427 RepID=A0A2H3DQK6_ARMGA|nr:hypothetical protein ARMGADRAFT_1027442 [Armillaria gallica]
MIGKKKALIISVFRTFSSTVKPPMPSSTTCKRKHRYGNEDEIEMEPQAIGTRRRDQGICIENSPSWINSDTLELDITFRELSFEGGPYRQPTIERLVHLTDSPFLVVTLERVQYSLKQFDLVLIFKDFNKAPLHINSIPSSQTDAVKNWLDFLGVSNGAESYFETEAREMESSSSDEESAYSDASGSESGSDFGEGSDNDEGDDWDELERKAAESDLKRAEAKQANGGDDPESDRPKKPKSNGKSSGKSSSKSKENGKKSNGKGK